MWSVYALIDPRDEQVRYVGKSVSVATRIAAHLRDRGSTRKARWIQQLLREGALPQVTILETGSGDWQIAETKWISHYRALGCDLTNLTSGGEGLHNPTAVTRELIRQAQRTIWGDPQLRAQREALYASEKWRAAVSAGLTGKAKTPEHIASLPQNQKGYPWSDEVRARRRECVLKYAVPAAHLAPPSEAQLKHLRHMSDSNRGKPGWAKGRVLSAEERLQRSVKQTGQPKSPEHKEKLRQAALRRWARVRAEKEVK